ncbi:MAG TPA: hypothetical protein VM096_08005 [Vicinamibacterales bacterium]|nr:hypothetical protein [Vicinamibacterales bacterium]
MHTLSGTEPFQTSITPAEVSREAEGIVAPDPFLWAAAMAMLIALLLQLSGKTPGGLLIALFAAPHLLLGICKRLVAGAAVNKHD